MDSLEIHKFHKHRAELIPHVPRSRVAFSGWHVDLHTKEKHSRFLAYVTEILS